MNPEITVMVPTNYKSMNEKMKGKIVMEREKEDTYEE
jgi:hypothetical protein